ncbi:hypothetical protein KC349_g5869 [Hortaea werneckii]|nr:hypothetical protein KC349_g5869 [Hortaea werneckii]
MVSFLSVSLYGLAAAAGFAGALPGLPKRIHEYWSKLAQHYLCSAYQLLFGSWQPIEDHSDFHQRGHGYHHGAFFTLYCWLSLFFWPRFDTYCHHKRDGRNLVRSRFYLEKLHAIFDCQQSALKLISDTYAKRLQFCSGVLLPEEFHRQFIACCFNSLQFSKHTYGNEDSTGVKLHSFLRQREHSVEWKSSVVN